MKTPKLTILTFLACLLFCGTASAQYLALYGAGSVNVPSGQVARIINFLGTGAELYYQPTGGTKLGILGTVNTTNPPAGSQEIYLPGPGTFSVSGGSGTTMLSYNLLAQPTTGSAGTPSNIVVVPTNANGQVQIILESSTDLSTWSAAQPGNYGGSTQNRFFRVRAQIQ